MSIRASLSQMGNLQPIRTPFTYALGFTLIAGQERWVTEDMCLLRKEGEPRQGED